MTRPFGSSFPQGFSGGGGGGETVGPAEGVREGTVTGEAATGFREEVETLLIDGKKGEVRMMYSSSFHPALCFFSLWCTLVVYFSLGVFPLASPRIPTS